MLLLLGRPRGQPLGAGSRCQTGDRVGCGIKTQNLSGDGRRAQNILLGFY
jgi:hypothetical protein